MEREHKPEGTRGFPRFEVFEKDAKKKTTTTIQIHCNVEITKSKIERENSEKRQT